VRLRLPRQRDTKIDTAISGEVPQLRTDLYDRFELSGDFRSAQGKAIFTSGGEATMVSEQNHCRGECDYDFGHERERFRGLHSGDISRFDPFHP
jgi:hypothetical protein